MVPEKKITISHWAKLRETVWNTFCIKGIYKILISITIDIATAPTKYILVKYLISNIECLSDLHSKTCISCDIISVLKAKVLQVSKVNP